MYHSQYISASRGRSRYINYARSVFQGSTARVHGQVIEMLSRDFGCDVRIDSPISAIVVLPQNELDPEIEMVLRVPDDIPMVTCSTSFPVERFSSRRISPAKLAKMVSELNCEGATRCEAGHFEAGPDAKSIEFVAWKHLTNDLRLYSLDRMVTAVARAHHRINEIFQRDMKATRPILEERALLAPAEAYAAVGAQGSSFARRAG